MADQVLVRQGATARRMATPAPDPCMHCHCVWVQVVGDTIFNLARMNEIDVSDPPTHTCDCSPDPSSAWLLVASDARTAHQRLWGIASCSLLPLVWQGTAQHPVVRSCAASRAFVAHGLCTVCPHPCRPACLCPGPLPGTCRLTLRQTGRMTRLASSAQRWARPRRSRPSGPRCATALCTQSFAAGW
jgi:hypothetical protein